MNVPVRWIMQQVDSSKGGGGILKSNNSNTNTMNPGGAFVQHTMADDIEQLWRDLSRDTIRINGELFFGDSGHGPENMTLLRRMAISVLNQETTSRRSIRQEHKVPTKPLASPSPLHRVKNLNFSQHKQVTLTRESTCQKSFAAVVTVIPEFWLLCHLVACVLQ